MSFNVTLQPNLNVQAKLGAVAPWPGGGGGPYVFVNAEAEAIVDEMTTEPNDTRKALIDNLVGSLKSASIWTRLDSLYIMAAHDSQAAGLNWSGPTGTALTAVNSPTFTTDEGYTTDGATSYLDPGVGQIMSGLTNYGLNDATLGCWITAAMADGVVGNIVGARNGGRAQLNKVAGGQDVFVKLNSGSGAGVQTDIGTVTGHITGVRDGSSSLRGYHNGSSIGTSGLGSTGTSTQQPFFGCLNQGGSPTSFVPAQFHAGYYGSELDSTAMSAIHSALNTYLTAVGAV